MMSSRDKSFWGDDGDIHVYTCQECGEKIYTGEVYEINDEILCKECMDEKYCIEKG